MSRRDTIFALSSARGRAGIAVIRISGPDAHLSVKHLTNIKNSVDRQAMRASIMDPRSREIIDQGLIVWFSAPKSFTGEDVAEFHIHGGSSVIAGVLSSLGSIPAFRPAEPGEFARRAFFNGKMDLTEVEGLADLISAETAAQRRQALRQLAGGYGQVFDRWRSELLKVLAKLEAHLDFPDEDLPIDLMAEVRDTALRLKGEISCYLDDGRRGERLRDGILVAIVGPPNAGKSSLINALSKRDVAIVAEEAGTTRDVVEIHMDLDGNPVTLADTAGIRDAKSSVEKEGVRRALSKAREADFKLVVVDSSAAAPLKGVGALIDGQCIVVFNKSDLSEKTGAELISDGSHRIAKFALVSALKGTGIDSLLDLVGSEVSARLANGEVAALTRARHRIALEDCRASLDRFLVADLPELAAEDLRHAADAVGRVTGRLEVEEVLDSIFREFCIGK